MTGKKVWGAGKGAGWGTMVLVDDHLLCLTNRGVLMLVKPDPSGFKKVTEFMAIPGKPVWTMPIVAHGKVYVRYKEKMICYDLLK